MTIEELLQTTSRTFALSIPLLPSPLDHRVTLSYLVFRISDTLEDADHLNRSDRVAGLHAFCEVLDDLNGDKAALWTREWSQRSISDDENYNRLLRETPQVISELQAMDEASRLAVVHHAKRSAQGMADVLETADEQGSLQLSSLEELRQYCYFVAGIVGELITELFVIDHEPLAESTVLRENGSAFGEGLQLVNILKDSSADKNCGRAYLPENTPLDDVFDLAFEDLKQADTYVEALREMKAPPGYIAFCDAPVQLAQATLRVVRENGPGSKVPREETFELLQGVMERAGLATS